MPDLLPAPVRGAIVVTLLVLNTLAWCLLLLPVALDKLALPCPGVRQRVDPVLNALATAWIACNGALLWRKRRVRWDVQGTDDLRPGDWHMVTCNHQSWVDIFVLQQTLSRRIPMLKFFLKQQLLYVPVIGLAWWALDFPFMRRHDKAALRKHPERRLQDREATRRACEKFALVPTSVMTFPEGTRFTPAKHASQAPRYRHLLKPKAGSLAMTLNAMGEQFRSLLDVTIVYPDGAPSFWALMCGRCDQVIVRVRQLPIAPDLRLGDYTADSVFRRRFHQWLDVLWQDKDQQIEALLQGEPAPAPAAQPEAACSEPS